MRPFMMLILVFVAVLSACGGSSGDAGGGGGGGDDACGIACGGVSNSSGTATGDETTGVYDDTAPTEGVTGPVYRLAPAPPLPGGVLDDAAMVALPGRKALVAGGYRTGNDPGPESYLYDGVANAWTTVGPMMTARRNHAMVRIADGRVLVSGGFDANNQALASAEIFDPATGAFTATGAMTAPRGFHSAVLLDDGRVLVVGGLFGAGSAAETWDPLTGQFTALAGNPAVERAAVKLNDGRVLLAGSTNTTAAIFDPATDSFATVGPMNSPHGNFPTVTLLDDGRVLIAGGQGTVFETSATDFFDPVANTFVQGPSMSLNRGRHAAFKLPNGDVMMLGGGDNGIVHDTAEYWDADQNVFVMLQTRLPGPRLSLVAVELFD